MRCSDVPFVAWRAALLAGAAAGLLSSEARGDERAPTASECATARVDAIQLRDAHRLRDALQAFAYCASPACPADVRTECETHVERVERALPTVVFAVKDADGDDLTSVTVTTDGQLPVHRLDGAAIPLDPGEHHLTFEAAGQQPTEMTIVVVAGVKAAVERVVMRRIPTEKRWYGWQTLLVDGASVLTIPFGIGIVGYFVGGPIVHLAHGHVGKAFGDLGLRVATPLVVGGVMLAALDSGGDTRGTDGAPPSAALIFVGLDLLVSAGVASVVDAAALAWEQRPVKPAQPAPTLVVPTVSMRGEQNGGTRTTVGLAGRF
jgi:hypothetical protein